MLRYLALSLVIHTLLFGVGQLLPSMDFLPQSTEVELVYVKNDQQSETKDKPFIRDLKIPDRLRDESQEEALFSSKERQRVLLETRATKSGFAENRQRGPRFLDKFADEKEEFSKNNMSYSQEGLPVLNIRKELGQLEQGESTIHVPLPENIAIGSFTALNTDRNLYYTFYSRIERQVYFRWAHLIRKAYDSFDQRKQAQLHRTGVLRTKLLILLNSKGEFERAELHMGSGVHKIDVSPALAFQEARIFPNPPQDLVKEDGYIHLNYLFTVDFRRVQ